MKTFSVTVINTTSQQSETLVVQARDEWQARKRAMMFTTIRFMGAFADYLVTEITTCSFASAGLHLGIG